MAEDGFKRKLAAILSADVEGYSRLMGQNEEQTIRMLTSYRAIIADFVNQYRGRVVDSPGDNILAAFSSVVDPDIDVPAVRSAVDIGGTVILQGTFNFGNETSPYTGPFPSPFNASYGYIPITKSVEIVGDGAIIENGFIPFWVEAKGYDVIIRDITLVNPTYNGILVLECESFLAKNVEISNAIAVLRPYNPYPQKMGIWADSGYDNGVPIPNKNLKKFHVIDCDVDLGITTNYEGGRGISAWAVGWPGDEVDILIKGNTVRNCSRHCVMVTDIAGTALIEDNVLITGNIAYLPEYGPNGIWTNQTYSYWDPPYESDWAEVTISNNYIESGPDVGGMITLGWGIFTDNRDGLVIYGNDIKTTLGVSNIWIGIGSHDDIIIKNNKFYGIGSYMTIDIESATKGTIMNNNFKGATPRGVHNWCFYADGNIFVGNNIPAEIPTYFFDWPSANNIVKGHTGGTNFALDIGTNNFLTGVPPMAGVGGIGDQVSEAVHELRERLSQDGM